MYSLSFYSMTRKKVMCYFKNIDFVSVGNRVIYFKRNSEKVFTYYEVINKINVTIEGKGIVVYADEFNIKEV